MWSTRGSFSALYSSLSLLILLLPVNVDKKKDLTLTKKRDFNVNKKGITIKYFTKKYPRIPVVFYYFYYGKETETLLILLLVFNYYHCMYYYPC